MGSFRQPIAPLLPLTYVVNISPTRQWNEEKGIPLDPILWASRVVSDGQSLGGLYRPAWTNRKAAMKGKD